MNHLDESILDFIHPVIEKSKNDLSDLNIITAEFKRRIKEEIPLIKNFLQPSTS